ncbi:uncharacterized protein HKW66_Vig0080260 [Vigna angularis]|uniref:Uncharacterized protein n=1 Tax=Phaseolus angularis TaxID=3914 RepID=A0A8T0KKD2_PHAAN|nr:uncharacterized protein HKW66_Vig0080260 [Vigna angularis]
MLTSMKLINMRSFSVVLNIILDLNDVDVIGNVDAIISTLPLTSNMLLLYILANDIGMEDQDSKSSQHRKMLFSGTSTSSGPGLKGQQ